jgi:hypothetical protein
MQARTSARAAALAVAIALIAAVPAGAATELMRGRLTDAGAGTGPGKVRVYAWPHHRKALSLPLVGQAETGPDGSFTVTASDDAQLQRLARQRNGWIDFIAVGDTSRHQGQKVFTAYVGRQGGHLRSVTPSGMTASAGTARIATADRTPTLAVNARQPLPSLATASAAGIDTSRCRADYQTQPVQKSRALTAVGELNNAYNDGTRGKFTYAQERTADTNIGVAISYDGGETFSIDSENHIADVGSVTFPRAERRYSRRLRTLFEYTREAARTDTCAPWTVRIRATSWIGGDDESIKQRGTLDRCDASRLQGHTPGTQFRRDSRAATRWTKGVEAFGVNISTQTGFSKNAVLDYAFGGRNGKPHYVCGSDGAQSPYESGRVFSGATH